MKVEIKVPTLGESILEGTIGQILKPSGSAVKADDELLEVETDKVNQMLYSPADGVLQLSVKTGDRVKVDQVIGAVDSEGKAAEAPAEKKEEKAPEKKEEAPPPEEKTPMPPSGEAVRKTVDESLKEEKAPAKEEKPAPRLPATPKEPPAKPIQVGGETRKKMSKLRRVIAQKLVEVKNQTAMLTTFNEVDMSAVMAVREKEKENFQKRHGVKLGFMSFFIKAAVSALQEFPDINARIEGDEIIYHQRFDIGVAVSTERGLMVPVIRKADQLNFAEIEQTLQKYAEKARKGTISIDDLQNGTFTITNGGVFGSLLSTPILNPPQSGILGMHNIVKRAVVVNDQIVIRPMMYLALSYDHRIVDGKEAITFLVHMKKNLEEPARLLLDL